MNDQPKNKIKSGRPRRYNDSEELLNAVNQYFIKTDDEKKWMRTDFIKSGERAGELVDIFVKTPYTVQGLIVHLEITPTTYYEYCDPDIHPDFASILTYAKARIDAQLVEGGTNNLFNPTIVSRLLGLRDNVDVTSEGQSIKPITSLIFNTNTFTDDK